MPAVSPILVTNPMVVAANAGFTLSVGLTVRKIGNIPFPAKAAIVKRMKTAVAGRNADPKTTLNVPMNPMTADMIIIGFRPTLSEITGTSSVPEAPPTPNADMTNPAETGSNPLSLIKKVNP